MEMPFMLCLSPCYEMPYNNDNGYSGAVCLVDQEVKNNDLVTEAEFRLLAEWPVSDLVKILNNPERSVALHADDYKRFYEKAGDVIEDLLGSVQTDLLTVRFGVGGVTYDLNSPFQFSEGFLTTLWRQERPISHWIRKEYEKLIEIAVLGRSYALAAAALDVQRISGMDRLESIENQCYDAYLRQIFLRAFNFYGICPLIHEELGIRGVDPWMQIVAGKDIAPVKCTGRQLELYARRQFRDFKIPFEVYSILKHLPLCVSVSQRLALTDWVELLQNELSVSWLRGESGEWIEKALESIAGSGSSDAQEYMMGA